MYCRRCGKYMDYDAQFCDECVEQEAKSKSKSTDVIETEPEPEQIVFEEQTIEQKPNYFESTTYTTTSYTPSAQSSLPGSTMTGFGGALTGLILCFISSIFFSIFLTEIIDGYNVVGGYRTNYISLLFLLILPITALSLGSKSIKRFKKEVRLGHKRPVATLVLGIITVIQSASFLFLFFILYMIEYSI